MNVIAFTSGSFIALFPLEAFTSLNGLNERRIVEEIGERYSFISSPDMSLTREKLEQSGLVFEWGVHETVAGQSPINRLSVHNDGVVVRSNRTNYAEAFFNDLTDWLMKEHGCREVRKRSLHVSEIVVDFQAPLAKVIDSYSEIANLLLSRMDKSRDVNAVGLSALSFEFATGDSMAAAKFLIERRVGTTLEEERYFCSAPLTTECHLQVLEEIERLIS